MTDKLSALSPRQRLARIASLIEAVDGRCLAGDGAVTRFQDEVTDAELRQIYRLSKYVRSNPKGRKP